MSTDYPSLQKYVDYLVKHSLDELISETIRKAKEARLSILQQLTHLSEAQLFEASKRGFLEDILLPLSEGKSLDKVYEATNRWKANALILPNDKVTIQDLIGIYHVRKLSMIEMLRTYEYSKEEGITLQKEIEDYFSKCLDIGYAAYEEIQRGTLKESRDILNGILQHMPVIVSRIDKEGNMLKSEGNGLSGLGLKDGELVGLNIFKINPSAENTRRALSGEKIAFQGTSTSKTGEVRYFQNYFFPEENGAIGFSIDITEQKTVEQRLKEVDYFIQQVADASPVMIQVYDRINNKDLYSNRTLGTILGYTSQQITDMGSAIGQIVHPDDLPRLAERNRRIEEARDGEVIESEMRARNAFGEYRWIYTRSAVFKRTDDGRVWQILNTSLDTSDKKLAEEKLEQQLRIFDTALSNSSHYHYIFDLDKRFIYLNKPLLKVYGRTQKEAFGKNFKELEIPESLVAVHNAQLQKVIDTKAPVSGENEYTNARGETGYFQYTFMPVLNEKGELEAIVGSGHDISEIKSLAEHQYRSIFQATNDAILIYDEEGNVAEVNPAACKMHGFEYKEMIGAEGTQFIHPEDYGKFMAFISDAKEGKHYFASLRHIRKDGSVIYVEKTGTGFTFKGKPHLLAVVHNITERKEAEEALRESEDRFRTLADNIPNLSWIAEPSGSTVWFNKKWYEYTGTTPAQMEGWGWQSVLHPDELLKALDGWNNSLATGKSFEMVIPLRGADAVYRPFLTRVNPVRDYDGKIVRWFGTNTDITAQIRVEENLERKNKELIKINNDLDNFIYTASHDLKSPISNLEGLLNMVSDENENLVTEKGRDILPLVSQSVKRLKMVIKELTEIARIQKDQEADAEKIDLQEMLDEVLDLCQNELKNFQGTVECDFSLAPELFFSRKNMRSILYNLVSNGIKYANPALKGNVWICSEIIHHQFVLTVRDNGLGIPENQQDKIFTMFKRYHTHVEGTGVGLYIVKRIIENAGGRIEVQSQEGNGSTFKVFLKH